MHLEMLADSTVIQNPNLVQLGTNQSCLSTGLKTTITGPITVPGAGAPERVNLSTGLKTTTTGPITVPGAAASKRSSAKVLSAANVPVLNKAAVIPSKTTDFRKFSNSKEDMDQPTTYIQS
ncbi:hypothetical protein D5086_021679 [Populus alba]|uniref:Uncharacterized protein n=1 Tax=Populus alba TaxID=43335 RepID=A0ACC4BDP8_POPAL